MNETEIITNINSILLEMDLPAVEEHHYDKKLIDFMGMDSLVFAEFIMKLEIRFDITLTHERAWDIQHMTFAELVSNVKELKGFKTVRA